MFIDESGQDQRESPYEVLAGVVVEDTKLWPLISKLHKAELEAFGCRYGTPSRELKANRLLKRKVFRHAALFPPIAREERTRLARKCLENGEKATRKQYAALGQAKIAYVERVLAITWDFRCRVFASIVPKEAVRPTDDHLRKDYAFLFERFFKFLELQASGQRGIVVFDELERSQSHLLINQMERYFVGTYTGRKRRSRILPEPFFVHSHLTTGIHLPDLVAYITSWGVRVHGMDADAREELRALSTATARLGYDMVEASRTVWAFNVLKDLRPSLMQQEQG
jgi:hypothetical protein